MIKNETEAVGETHKSLHLNNLIKHAILWGHVMVAIKKSYVWAIFTSVVVTGSSYKLNKNSSFTSHWLCKQNCIVVVAVTLIA